MGEIGAAGVPLLARESAVIISQHMATTKKTDSLQLHDALLDITPVIWQRLWIRNLR